ncbi:MAG: glycosyltransferase [bacterium]
MKILQIGKFPREYCGGVENAVFSLSETLSKNHDVEVVTGSLGRCGGVERSARIVCRRLPTWFRLFSTPITPALLPYLRQASGFDIIQISFQNPMAVMAYLLARPEGKLVVWYHHDIVRQSAAGFFFYPFLYQVLKKASAIVATSAPYAASSGLLRRFSGKTTVIPLGIDDEALNIEADIAESRRVRSRLGSPLVLFVGRLVYYKGLPFLIEAMRGLDARLLIIGRGPMETQLREQAARLGITYKIIFQKVPLEESIARYLHACDLLVLPSTKRTEAFGIALLETMACAKPVVTTELGTGTSFVCRHGETGLVVPPRDATALREAIRMLLSDPDMARRMGKEGKKRVERYFSIHAMTESFLGLYGRLLNGGKIC